MDRLLVFLPPGGPPDGYFEAAVERASSTGAGIEALYVVDALWGRYCSADWLSTGPSREQFNSYMKETLSEEGRGLSGTLAGLSEAEGVPYAYTCCEGDPDEALAAFSRGAGVVGVLIPAGRPELAGAVGDTGCDVFTYGPM